MTANVVALSGLPVRPKGEPNIALIKVLEDALEMARTGQLQSLIGTGFTTDGQRASFWCSGDLDVYAMLGSLAWLQHEYVARITGKAI